MPNTYTTNLNLTLPQVGGDTDAWGTDLNNDLTALDGIFASAGSGTSVGLQVGSGKVLAVGGTLTVSGALTVSGTLSAGSATLSSPWSYAQGGTGLTSVPANGQIDIGNGTGFTRTALTAGSNVTITNGAGSITIAATNSGGTVTSVNASGGTTGAPHLRGRRS